MPADYELFDHTADMGVRIRASSLPELIETAAQGLYAVIGDLVPEGQGHPETLALGGGDTAELLRDFLSELLLIFERDFRMLTDVRVETYEPGRLVVAGESRPVSREKSVLDREIKAVTYHGLEIRSVEGGFEATYIVDI